MAINQISTANTFEEWLSTTSTLVAVANNLTDNTNGGFLANSSIYIQGSEASLNVRTLANINTLQANTGNISNISLISGSVTGNGNLTFQGATINDLTFGNVVVTGNIQTVNVTTSLNVGGNSVISGNLRINGNTIIDGVSSNITGNLIVGGNIAVANITSNAYIGGDTFIYGNLTITGNTTLDSIGFNDLNVAGRIWLSYKSCLLLFI